MVEPDSNTITSEELATRVRRVVGRRFRRDAASERISAAPKIVGQAKNWSARVYDFLMISLALFLVSVLLLNLTIAGSWRERSKPWDDRANWQRELRKWEQQLTKQEQRLEAECQALAGTLIARRDPETAQQILEQVSELRQRLREANQSLAAMPRGENPSSTDVIENNREPEQLSVAVLTTKREQLIEAQYAARGQYNADHPKLQEIEQQLNELERQLELAEAASSTAAPESRVQVIENQFLRNASASPGPRPTAKPSEETPEFRRMETAFSQLRQTTERFLRELDAQEQLLQQSDNQRAIAWEQVAAALRSMARDCALPAALQQSIEQPPPQRSEPSLSPLALFFGLVGSLSCAGFVLWYSHRQSGKALVAAPATDEQLSINLVTKHLGCAPGAIVAWELPQAVTDDSQMPARGMQSSPRLAHRMRFASECFLAVAIAATVILTLTHGQFGDWLLADPLTAWGRWWGS